MEDVAGSEARRRAVDIAAGGRSLAARLHVPRRAQGLVLVADGRGDSEVPDLVAAALHAAQIATLELDLGEQVGNFGPASGTVVTSLADQVLAAADWVSAQPELSALPLGIFGSEAAGGIALAAAARRPGMFRAVVTKAGRPDLALGPSDIHSATLLLVAGHDDPALLVNQEAMARVRGIAELEILPGPADSLEEGPALAHVARITRRWFARFLS